MLSWLNAICFFSRIMKRIPPKLMQYTAIIDVNVEEIKNDYILATKKSVVNFILGKSPGESFKTDAPVDRSELHGMQNRFMNK